MSKTARYELLESLRPQYRRASWREKQGLLDGFVAATGYERKYAIVLLNQEEAFKPNQTRVRKRKYGDDIREALLVIWKKAGNRLCSKRLAAIMPTFIAKMELFGHLMLSEEQKLKLMSLSPATIDRLLLPERKKYGRGKSRTKPGHLLKRQIAVRTFGDWSDVKAGFVEADLVAHCGESVHGQFLNTLTVTDVATTWTEPVALLRKSEENVKAAMCGVRESLPFPLLGFDTDNGGEFINYTLLDWCKENNITFTRSREYKKNDQAYVEEKNGSIVRKIVGYDRYEGIESWKLLSELYEVARLYVNFFQPSAKLLSKRRDGAHVYRRHEIPQTPYERVLKAGTVPEENKEKLRLQFDSLDPVFLLGELERLQRDFWRTAVDPDSPSSRDPGKTIPARTRRRKAKQKSHSPVARTPRIASTANLGDVWPEVCSELETNPGLSARQILRLLNERYPGRFRPTQVSTIHDKLKAWRTVNLPGKYQGARQSAHY